MFRYLSTHKTRLLAVGGLTLLLLAALLFGVQPAKVEAQPGPDDTLVVQKTGPEQANGWDDGGAWEVGAESAGGSLAPYAYSEASYLYNRLGACGWNRRYLYNNSLSWEEDFKRANLGGTENYYADSVDLAFYIGHGSPWGFTFDATTHDDSTLSSNDCSGAWGDLDNEWVALTSCQVLGNANLNGWANCMNGSHQILGFITNAYARTGTGTQGYNFANYLCNNWTVTAAWFKACDVTQPAGTAVRALADKLADYNDRPWSGISAADTTTGGYWWWDHACGSPLPQPMDTAPLEGQMPVFRTVPLSLDEANQEADHLGSVFAVPPPVVALATADDDLWHSGDGSGPDLEMDPNSGQFAFYDTANLWNTAGAVQAQAAGPSITLADARQIADHFLQQNGLMPGDAQYYETVADTINSQPSNDLAAQAAGAGDPTVYQVLYSRHVQGTVLAQDGSAVTTDFMVTGPGGKLKVYVDTAAPTAASAGADPVLGTLGGWQKVQQPGASRGPAFAETVPILSEAQILELFAKLPNQVVINTPPIDADSSQVLSTTLAYWEEGMGTAQSELVPVYALHVSWMKDGAELLKDFAYIPANQGYMRPFARVLTSPTSPVNVGQSITLVAEDATKMLSELGYPASLNFFLGTGDYQYDWYLGGLDLANRIGGGRTFNYVVKADAEAHGDSTQQTIILKVTDIGGADLRSNTANAVITVNPRITMPLMLKQH